MTPEHPPKPRLVLRVGITGHRPDKLKGPAVARVEKQLPLVFDAIGRAATEILQANASAYAEQRPLIRLVCGFAEGADQMAVAAWPDDPDNWPIQAILPFPKKEYLKDFEQSAAGDGRDVRGDFEASLARASAVAELPYQQSRNRDQGYADAGGYLLRQTDLLVAVWDGKPPKTGGTGALAREAFEGGIPVVWLSTRDDPMVPRLITEFGSSGAPIPSGADCTKGPLTDTLAPIFAAPSPHQGHGGSPRLGLDGFRAELWPPACYFPLYDLLKRAANLQRPRFVIRSDPYDKRLHEWDQFIAATPAATSLRQRVNDILVPRYVWADALAVHFSHLYRSAYVLAYLFSAAAVFIALAGSFAPTLNEKAAYVLAELVTIGTIIGVVAIGYVWSWHERWLHYRVLAENLRHGRFLAFVSEFGRSQESSRGPNKSDQPWVLWYIRATMREIGLPRATLDADYQWQLLKATRTYEVEEQVGYHTGNRGSMHRIDMVLHYSGIACFCVTFAILAVFLFGYGYEWIFGDLAEAANKRPMTGPGSLPVSLKPWMIVFTAGLPALGAALTGIRVQGDFEGSMERSAHTLEALEALKEDYAAAMNHVTGLDDTAELLIETARIMSEDLAAWQDLYGRKRLTLPA